MHRLQSADVQAVVAVRKDHTFFFWQNCVYFQIGSIRAASQARSSATRHAFRHSCKIIRLVRV